MSLRKWFKGRKQKHVVENNVLIISSSARSLYEVVEKLGDNYETNIDKPIILDNGDFAIVVKRI